MKIVRFALIVLVTITVLYFAAFRMGWISLRPIVLASLVSLVLVLVCTGMVLTALRVAVKQSRLRGVAAELLVLAGLILIFGGGLANWLQSLEGYVILSELEAVPLVGGTHLQDFEAGPLARIEEMGVMLQLEELDLKAAAGGFYPESRIRCQADDGSVELLTISQSSSASWKTLRLHQGAFGFAPRIVILKDGRTVFDEVVPFLTRLHDEAGISFEGDFTLSSEDLHVRGEVNLDTLDAWMRGHAKLRLRVERGGAELGRGELLPGQFADIWEGYRIGFAGLSKWSEIDISRRNYPKPMIAGFAIALSGACLAPIAHWRKW